MVLYDGSYLLWKEPSNVDDIYTWGGNSAPIFVPTDSCLLI